MVLTSLHDLGGLIAISLGICIGSFLNVVIYRTPLGMSVNEPKRSFCPLCQTQIPMWHNIPVLSWLLLRGKCAHCGGRISIRYWIVEILTGALFGLCWYFFPPSVSWILCLILSIWIVVSFIDAEHLVIPTAFTWVGSALGLLACGLWPQLSHLSGVMGDWKMGLQSSIIGWSLGFGGLWCIVQLGKWAFGKKKLAFEDTQKWSLVEPTSEDETLCFVIADESIPWWDLFSRKSDQLVLQASEILLDGKSIQSGQLIIREHEILLPDQTTKNIAEIDSLEGLATEVTIPREAMGMGDIHLLGMIGACFGWTGVLFTLFSSSLFALAYAVIARIRFGKPLPFGPFLVLGAITWMFGGWQLWAWYMDSISISFTPY
jgi:leader peptidase (prepilin peptidase)/N-methyltransferase